MQSTTPVPSLVDIQFCDYQAVRQALLDKREIAFLDVREEDSHARSHPFLRPIFPFRVLSSMHIASYRDAMSGL